MKEMEVFKNAELGSVRVVMVNEEPYFVGKDVAEILGYSNASKALADHVDDDDKLNNESLSSLGQRGGWIINDAGICARWPASCRTARSSATSSASLRPR